MAQAAKIRQQAADLISRIAVVMKACDEEKLLGHLGVVLYEYLGEEYPEVLGSILGALKSIVNVIGMTKARATALAALCVTQLRDPQNQGVLDAGLLQVCSLTARQFSCMFSPSHCGCAVSCHLQSAVYRVTIILS